MCLQQVLGDTKFYKHNVWERVIFVQNAIRNNIEVRHIYLPTYILEYRLLFFEENQNILANRFVH